MNCPVGLTTDWLSCLDGTQTGHPAAGRARTVRALLTSPTRSAHRPRAHGPTLERAAGTLWLATRTRTRCVRPRWPRLCGPSRTAPAASSPSTRTTSATEPKFVVVLPPLVVNPSHVCRVRDRVICRVARAVSSVRPLATTRCSSSRESRWLVTLTSSARRRVCDSAAFRWTCV